MELEVLVMALMFVQMSFFLQFTLTEATFHLRKKNAINKNTLAMIFLRRISGICDIGTNSKDEKCQIFWLKNEFRS